MKSNSNKDNETVDADTSISGHERTVQNINGLFISLARDASEMVSKNFTSI